MWIHFKTSGRTSDNGFSGHKRAVVIPVLSDTTHAHTCTCTCFYFVFKTIVHWLHTFLLVFTRLEKVGWMMTAYYLGSDLCDVDAETSCLTIIKHQRRIGIVIAPPAGVFTLIVINNWSSSHFSVSVRCLTLPIANILSNGSTSTTKLLHVSFLLLTPSGLLWHIKTWGVRYVHIPEVNGNYWKIYGGVANGWQLVLYRNEWLVD